MVAAAISGFRLLETASPSRGIGDGSGGRYDGLAPDSAGPAVRPHDLCAVSDLPTIPEHALCMSRVTMVLGAGATDLLTMLEPAVSTATKVQQLLL